MSKDYGLSVTNPKQIAFNGGNRHMLLDLTADPAQFDIVKVQGTGLVAGAGETKTEQLLKIDHKLGFIPYAECYFYPAGNATNTAFGPNAFFDNTGIYSKNVYYFAVTGSVADGLYMSVSNTSLTIRHDYYNAAGGTSGAATLPVYVKYYIFSNVGYDPTSKYVLQTLD